MSIENHEFTGDIRPIKVLSANQTAVVICTKNIPWLALDKNDAIALAKHFNLTAYDIDCSEFKELQIDANQADESHHDEIVSIKATAINTSKRIS